MSATKKILNKFTRFAGQSNLLGSFIWLASKTKLSGLVVGVTLGKAVEALEENEKI